MVKVPGYRRYRSTVVAFGGLLVAMAVAGVVCFFLSTIPGSDSEGRTLQFGIEGCTKDVSLKDGLTCLIEQRSDAVAGKGESAELRFAVRTQPGAEIVVELPRGGTWSWRSARFGDIVSASALGEAQLRVRVPSGTSSLTLRARDQKSHQVLGQTKVRLSWIPMRPLDVEVRDASTFTQARQQQDILQRLQHELNKAHTPKEQAPILLHIATLRYDYLKTNTKTKAEMPTEQVQELQSTLAKALLALETEPGQHLRSAARILSMQAYLAYEDPAQRPHLRHKLEQAIQHLEILPVEQCHLYYYLAEIARLNKDLRSAREHLESALTAARWIGDQSLILSKRAWWIRELFSEGLDVEKELAEQERDIRQLTNPCEKARLLQNLAWIHLLNWEITPGVTKDPLPLFEEVLGISAGKQALCPNALRAQYALTSKARRLSLLPPATNVEPSSSFGHWVHSVQQTIDEARALSEREAVVSLVEVDLQFAAARLALAQHHVEEAARRFAKLAELTQQSSVIEDRWEAICGAAAMQTLVEQGQPLPKKGRLAQNSRLLAQCSDMLDELVGKVWLATQTRAMDPRDRGFGRLLAMLSSGDNQALMPEVLKAMRQAGRRASASYRWPFSNNEFPPEELIKLLDAYRQERAGFEEEQKRSWPKQLVHSFNLPADLHARVSKRRHALDLLDQFFTRVHEQPGGSAWRSLPDIPADDLLLTCHSTGQGVFCITALDKEFHAVSFDPHRFSKAEVAEKIFGPWRSRLPATYSRRAETIRRLRVIAHGWLRDTTLFDWPLDGQPLISRLPIVYSIDIQPVSAPPPTGGAVLAIHPGSSLGGADDTLRMVHDHLRAVFPQQLYFSVDVRQFVSARVDSGPTYDRLYPAHNSAALFVALGHFKPGLCSADPSPLGLALQASPWLTALCLPEKNSLWPSDVLLAPRVPEFALLLGCSSGKQEEQTSTSSVNMAVAYLLRGSKAVLGTTRDIARPLAQQMLCYVTKDQELNTPRFDLPRAVQEAQRALIARKPCPDGVPVSELQNPDWTAFRVYVP